MDNKPVITVLGSFMTDITSYVTNLPRSGETLFGHKLSICCGGKGANQGVTASRLGAPTAIIGKLGDDSFGHSYLNALKVENINTDNVSLTSQAVTGVAQITVEDSGQNNIVIVAGANNWLTPEDVTQSGQAITQAKILLCVLEIPRQAVLTGLRMANSHGVFTVCNAAPAASDLEDEFYSLSDIFCVNETEAELLTELPVTTSEEAVAAARQLITVKGCKNHVLITLGSKGALLLSKNNISQPEFVDSPQVEAVDTTGAGDCFLGALAYFMVTNPEWSLKKAISNACRVAAVSVQASGTQTSFPSKDQLDSTYFV